MLSNTQLTLIRSVATIIITGIAAVQPLYPSYTWITAVLAVSAAVGIHAIPSISQNVVTKGSTMSVQDNGLVAMGLQAPSQEAPETPQSDAQTPEATEPAETAPEASPQAEASVAPQVSDARQALTDAANALLKIAETL